MTQADRKKYRIEIPNIVDDMDLSVYAFRLYAHIKRVAGEDGQCWQGSKTLAAACKMSVGKVSGAKNELIEAGLITVIPGEWNKGKSDEITVVDIWGDNLETFSPHEKVGAKKAETFSQNEKTFSPRESTFSPREPKKEPVKKEPVKNLSSEPQPTTKPETTDRDGRWLLQKLESKGFMHLDSMPVVMAMKLESDYTDDQLLPAIEKTYEAHMKKISGGGRGITAPMAYMKSVLAGNEPTYTNGHNNGVPVRKTQTARSRMQILNG